MAAPEPSCEPLPYSVLQSAPDSGSYSFDRDHVKLVSTSQRFSLVDHMTPLIRARAASVF